MNDEAHFDEGSQRILVTEEESGSEALILRLAARFEVSPGAVAEMVSEVQEAIAAGDLPAGSGEREGAIAEYRVVHDLITRGFMLLQSYEKQAGDRVMAERCLWLLLGFPTLSGADNLAGLVKLLGRKKATVNKCLQFFQRKMPELPILPGQRDEAARENMSVAQTRIWHGNSTANGRE